MFPWIERPRVNGHHRRAPRPRRLADRRRRPTLEALEPRTVLSSCTFVVASGGDFNNPANWRDQNNHAVVPGPTDDVTIKSSGTVVVVNRADTIHNFNGSGTIDLVNGTLTLLNSTINGSIVVGFNQSLHIQGTVKNTGIITVMPGAALDIQGVLNNAGQIHLVGGFTHGANRPATISGTGTLNNTGLLKKEGILNTSASFVTVNDLGGMIQVTGGSLSIHGGRSLGGNYLVRPGCTLELSGGGDRTISGSFVASGGGLVTITTQAHKLLVADAGATFNFPAGMLQILGGNISAATKGAHPTLKNLGTITVPAGTAGYTLVIDAVHVLNIGFGGRFIRLGKSQVILQNGATLV
jgi:hypothetical protein